MTSEDELAPWRDRWQKRQIGFHEGKPNAFLTTHLDALKNESSAPSAGPRVLVPLCGKAVDLVYLAERGYQVMGVELVTSAIEELFSERGVTPTKHSLGPHAAFTYENLTLVSGDIFTMAPEHLGLFDALYDRAALIAILPSSRARYVATCSALLKPGAPSLIIGLAYPQHVVDGPPFSVDDAVIASLFAGRSIQTLESKETPAPPRHMAAGLSTVVETAYRVL
jgi:thiopurine S-methyltransferase